MSFTELEIRSSCFNTQPPEGGCACCFLGDHIQHCFNTQPPEGGCWHFHCFYLPISGFNTQPPEGGCNIYSDLEIELIKFQHTATRRWLPSAGGAANYYAQVSTHSHPKVAAHQIFLIFVYIQSFNTQPPEGGCGSFLIGNSHYVSFNTQPPEGGCYAQCKRFY